MGTRRDDDDCDRDRDQDHVTLLFKIHLIEIKFASLASIAISQNDSCYFVLKGFVTISRSTIHFHFLNWFSAPRACSRSSRIARPVKCQNNHRFHSVTVKSQVSSTFSLFKFTGQNVEGFFKFYCFLNILLRRWPQNVALSEMGDASDRTEHEGLLSSRYMSDRLGIRRLLRRRRHRKNRVIVSNRNRRRTLALLPSYQLAR